MPKRFLMLFITLSVIAKSAWYMDFKVYAEGSGSLSSVTEEAQILPVPDSDGKYMLKSDGFYCLNEDGTKDTLPSVHYFDHFVIDGTVFDGYYYHDGSGKFTAQEPHLEKLEASVLPKDGEGNPLAGWTEGIYMVKNLGRLCGPARICQLEKEEIDKTRLDGYYYLDEKGQLILEGGIHYVEYQTVDDREFSGYYYFDETTGALSGETVMESGLTVNKDGKVEELTQPGIRNLKNALESYLADLEGEWSIYVKDLGTRKKFAINDKAMSSASLIKAFTMAASYADMETIRENEGALLKADPASDAVSNKIYRLMENMVTFSDNESFNEMIRLQTASGQFNAGARVVNRYLRGEGYTETAVLHTLSPSETEPAGLGSSNTTSVKDCGTLLERIYRGKCVSEEASAQMLSLLLQQDTRTKIPGGLSETLSIANKTGENDLCQHDIAIVYGERTDYILCVMSENAGKEEDAVQNIRKISAMVYYYLNW